MAFSKQCSLALCVTKATASEKLQAAVAQKVDSSTLLICGVFDESRLRALYAVHVISHLHLRSSLGTVGLRSLLRSAPGAKIDITGKLRSQAIQACASQHQKLTRLHVMRVAAETTQL